MFVYTINNMFGQTVVSKINRLPNGSVSIVSTTDVSKALNYEEVERLLTVSERRARGLEFSWLEVQPTRPEQVKPLLGTDGRHGKSPWPDEGMSRNHQHCRSQLRQPVKQKLNNGESGSLARKGERL